MPAATIMATPMRRSIRLQAFLEQGREYDLLTVLAALDEDMAEWLFDLLAEASCSVLLDGPADEKLSYAMMAALELPLQANLPIR